MAFARERIVPQLPAGAWRVGWRFTALGAALGLFVGVFVRDMVVSCMQSASLGGEVGSVVGLASAIGLVVLAISPVPLLLRVTQRWSAVLGFAAAYCAGTLVGAHTIETLNRADGGADPAEWIDFRGDVRLAVVAGGYFAASVILWPFFRLFLVRTVEHTPGNCSWCGYTRGAEQITRCPECGRPPSPLRYRFHRQGSAFAWLAHRSGVVLALSLAALGIMALWPLWNRTFPSARFYARFRAGVPMTTTAWRAGPFTARALDSSAQVWIPETHGSAGGLYISQQIGSHLPRASRTSMIVGVGLVPVEASGQRWANYGWPLITMTLDAEQSEWVLVRGLPPALVRAIHVQADEAGWPSKTYVVGDFRMRPDPAWFPK